MEGKGRTTVQRGSCLWNGIKTRAGSQLQETGLTVGKRGREAYTHAAAARVVFFFGGPYFCSCRVWRRATHATHATLAVHSCSLLLFTQPVHAPHTPLTCSDHLSPRGFSTIPSLRRLFRSSSTGPPTHPHPVPLPPSFVPPDPPDRGHPVQELCKGELGLRRQGKREETSGVCTARIV